MEEKHETIRKHEKTRILTRNHTKAVSYLCLFVFVFVAFSVCGAAEAATLYLSPSSGIYNVSQTFQVSVFVSSNDQPANAYSGTISFTQQNLEVVSISQTGSIVNFWAQEPGFLNNIGRVNFEGVTFHPGFQGTSGRIITVTFKAKAAGTAVLSFAESAVLAADGKGTNILKTVSGAEYSIGVGTITEPEPGIKPDPKPETEPPDTNPPEPFEIAVEDSKFIFETTDKGSGMDYYKIILNDKPYNTVLPGDIPPYEYKFLPFGIYSLEVRAFDKAGNFTSAFADFEVLPIGDIVITEIPSKINIGEILTIKGKTLPELLVKIYIQKKGDEPSIAETQSDSTGNFIIQYDKALARGDYFVWAQGGNEKGFLTNPSQKHSLYIDLPPFLKFGKVAIDYLATIFTLIALLVAMAVIIFYGRYKIFRWRKKLKKETKEASQSIVGAFKALREEVEEQIEYLDGKPGLNQDERKVRDKLRKALDVSEKFIDKEVKDIEKELK